MIFQNDPEYEENDFLVFEDLDINKIDKENYNCEYEEFNCCNEDQCANIYWRQINTFEFEYNDIYCSYCKEPVDLHIFREKLEKLF